MIPKARATKAKSGECHSIKRKSLCTAQVKQPQNEEKDLKKINLIKD